MRQIIKIVSVLGLFLITACSQNEAPQRTSDQVVKLSPLLSLGISPSGDLGEFKPTDSSKLATFKITNNGDEAYVGGSEITLDGPDLTKFAIIYNSCTASLTVKKYCQLKISFNPKGLADGTYGVNLMLSPEISFPLTATVKDPNAPAPGGPQAAPIQVLVDNSDASTGIDLGLLGPNTSVQKLVYFKNVSSYAQPVDVLLEDLVNYTAAANTCVNKTLSPKASCYVRLLFSSSDKPNGGVFNTSLVMNGDGLIVPVTATVDAPVVISDPTPEEAANILQYSENGLAVSSLDFGSFKVTDSGVMKLITLKNISTDKLLVNAQLDDLTNYSLMSNSCVNKTLNAGSTCYVRVSFAPTNKDPGLYPAKLSSNNLDLNLSATIEAPIQVAAGDSPPPGEEKYAVLGLYDGENLMQDQVDFGSISGTDLVTKILELRNTGTDNSQPLTATVIGDQFFVGQNTCINKILSPGARCSIRIAFQAGNKGNGSYSAQLIASSLSYNLLGEVLGQTECPEGEHIEIGKCKPDLKACSVDNGKAVQAWDQEVNTYGICSPYMCESGFEIANNSCLGVCGGDEHRDPETFNCQNNLQDCSGDNGAQGTQSWLANQWSVCSIESCTIAGYHLVNNACELDVVDCLAEELPQGALSGTKSWEGTGYGTCQATSCDNDLYVLSGQCTSEVQVSVAKNQVVGGSSTSVSISGGTAPYQVEVDSSLGSMVDDTNFSAGTNTTGSSVNETILVTDSLGQQASVEVSILPSLIAEVSTPAIAPGGTAQVTASGGFVTSGLTYEVLSGEGSIDSAGLYSAPSSVASPIAVVIKVSDNDTPVNSVEVNLTVYQSLSVTPTSLSLGANEAGALTITGGSGDYEVVFRDTADSVLGGVLSANTYTAGSTSGLEVLQVRDNTLNQSIDVTVTVTAAHIVQVVAGYSNGCAIYDDASVKCMGSNGTGQIGNGTTGATDWSSLRTVKMSDNTSFKVKLSDYTGEYLMAIGSNHMCAVKAEDNKFYCWGDNSVGQMGTGSTSGPVLNPQEVPGQNFPQFNSYSKMAAGSNSTCVLYGNGGTVSCWGQNNQGQLGAFTTSTYMSLVDAGQVWYNNGSSNNSLSNASSLNAGSNHYCATKVTTCGKGCTPTVATYCWGSSSNGQLGRGIVASNPIAKSFLNGSTTITTQDFVLGGDQTCYRITVGGKGDGTTYACTGSNAGGGLGNTSLAVGNNYTTGQTVNSIPTGYIQSFQMGYHRGCAIHGGGFNCWGEGYSNSSSSISVNVVDFAYPYLMNTGSGNMTCYTDYETTSKLYCIQDQATALSPFIGQ